MSLADHFPAAGSAPAAHDPSVSRRLVVAVDDSGEVGAAASFAIWLAGTARADVTLLHARRDPDGVTGLLHSSASRAMLRHASRPVLVARRRS